MTVSHAPAQEAHCVGCGQAMPRRWLICAHWCEHCQDVRHLVAVLSGGATTRTETRTLPTPFGP